MPILFTEEGMETSNNVHIWNPFFLISVNVEGSVICESEVQPLKASSLIVVNDEGSITSVRDVHSKNDFLSFVVNDKGIEILVNEAQPLKEPTPI